MCGLVALWSKKNKPVGQQVFNLYDKQKLRGKQGYGYLAIDKDGKLVGIHRSKTEGSIKKLLNKEKAPMVLFHHRFPTSTDNTMGTTHPMKVVNDELTYDWYVSHNGIIRNASVRKTAHELLGYEYVTEHHEEYEAVYADGTREYIGGKGSKFNDSESLAIEMARHLEGMQEDIHCRGPVAFWAVKMAKGTDQVLGIYYGKNEGRDLTTVKGKNYEGIASENGADIDAMKIFSYELGDPQLYEQEFPIDESRPVVTKAIATHSTNGILSVYETNRLRDAYASLEHRGYSYSEALATGANINAFAGTLVDGFMEYVPRKFAQYNKANRVDMQPAHRKPMGFSVDLDDEDDDSETDDIKKARSILEGLALQYASLQTQIGKADDGYSLGYITEVQCDEQIGLLEVQKSALEDTMSGLGLDEQEVEAMVDTCLELEDYQESLPTQ